MAFRIVWHDGWPYPVTGHPFRPDEEGNHWYVQTRDGIWHSVVRRRPGSSLQDAWEEIEGPLREWLTANSPTAAYDLPPTLRVEVVLHPPAGGLARLRPLLGGIVTTERGQCYVELAAITQLSAPQKTDVWTQALNRDPAVFNVTFRTTTYPFGVHLQFDVSEFLKAVVQQYLHHRPTEAPISHPTG